MSHKPYQAVMFDLLTALLNSWSLWNKVVGSERVGFDWRQRYLQLTYQAGPYRSYEDIIKEAAHEVGVPYARAEELIQRWGESWNRGLKRLRLCTPYWRRGLSP
jgi:2-haloacid dehalogenase